MSDSSPPDQRSGQTWDPQSYIHHAGFVPALGEPVLDLLNPRAGEDILDLGCGDGALTIKLAEAGANVVGVDASADQVASARAKGLDAHVSDGHALEFERRFDAVFSNAALHWMTRPDSVLAGVARSLRPGGRFVGEFGGAGNVNHIRNALHAVVASFGLDPDKLDPWFFPTVEDYRARLEANGFDVVVCELIDRPTPLPTDMAGWIGVMGGGFLNGLPEADRDAAVAEAVDRLRPILFTDNQGWIADYVRLRFSARLAAAPVE